MKFEVGINNDTKVPDLQSVRYGYGAKEIRIFRVRGAKVEYLAFLFVDFQAVFIRPFENSVDCLSAEDALNAIRRKKRSNPPSLRF